METAGIAVMDRCAAETEVLEKPARRTYTSEYKQRIVREVERCRGSGEIGAILRREGLYSSMLTKWRRQYHQARENILTMKRGRKATMSPLEKENARLRKENQDLKQQLEDAELVIEAQKKISELFGISQNISNNSERD